MAAYAELQQREFASEVRDTATRHQREVGTDFDEVSMVIGALYDRLHGSTEEEPPRFDFHSVGSSEIA